MMTVSMLSEFMVLEVLQEQFFLSFLYVHHG